MTNQKWIGNNFVYSATVDNCDTCNIFNGQSNGGYVTKRARNTPSNAASLAFDISQENIFQELVKDLPDIDTQGLTPVGLTTVQQINETCQICKCLYPPKTVYISQCQHMFCATCLSQTCKLKGQNTVPCPSCRSDIHYSTVEKLNRQLQIRLMDLQVECTSCKYTASMSMMAGHTCNSMPSPLHHVSPRTTVGGILPGGPLQVSPSMPAPSQHHVSPRTPVGQLLPGGPLQVSPSMPAPSQRHVSPRTPVGGAYSGVLPEGPLQVFPSLPGSIAHPTLTHPGTTVGGLHRIPRRMLQVSLDVQVGSHVQEPVKISQMMKF